MAEIDKEALDFKLQACVEALFIVTVHDIHLLDSKKTWLFQSVEF